MPLYRGHLITDNFLVAYVMLNTLKQKKGGREGFLALKLDMSKTYDRVEWKFLDVMMQKLGFHSRWISYIMNCVSSVSYSLMINGNITNDFFP